ncbi:hypothetical protein [Burkholderia ubonensis]|uniref:hypothetical protein n=1 Tax=Burkholderia ubonensis TaxID=101571 RepID=UPI000B144A82|nr:hypothetical protein [Burkholderia ubonensis]
MKGIFVNRFEIAMMTRRRRRVSRTHGGNTDGNRFHRIGTPARMQSPGKAAAHLKAQ